jgi:probable F420-dependent oxidoreductase
VKFGVVLPSFGPGARGPEAMRRVRDLAMHADRLGFHVLWTAEHLIFPRSIATPYPYGGSFPFPVTDPILDPLIALTWAAAVTENIHLGTAVLVAPYRHPVVLAKQLATLDSMSGGRALLGIASGWLREEFEMLGVPFRERGARTDEAIGLLRALWKDDSVTFRGRWTTLEDAAFFPKPHRRPGPPIWIGGGSPAALRRTARLGDGWLGVPRPSLGELATDIEKIRRLAEEAGRDPRAIGVASSGAARSVDELVARLPELEKIGITIANVPIYSWTNDFDRALDQMSELAEDVGLCP